MRHLEDTPWWICDEGDFNFCAYVDTDSNYFNAEPLLKHLYPDFEDKIDQEKDDLLEKVALKYQDIITEYYDILAKEAFNVPTHRLEMKTEAVIRSAYFRATRRYAQWITKKEGRAVEELDIKGLEFKKANFPKYFGKFYQEILELIIKGTPQSIVDKIASQEASPTQRLNSLLGFASEMPKNQPSPINLTGGMSTFNDGSTKGVGMGGRVGAELPLDERVRMQLGVSGGGQDITYAMGTPYEGRSARYDITGIDATIRDLAKNREFGAEVKKAFGNSLLPSIFYRQRF
jgi:hypothetical protein